MEYNFFLCVQFVGFPNQESNVGSWQWEHGALTTGLPGEYNL